ncbi:hypothetical protein AVEN_248685-1 [Araneus ventricosus]|uniref:Uncharacterized protein n=1 Tax=Araneus ventricosus TaxID=182803 RepID=A0A4Y2BZV6_ARAVE|nr:hypothetical protein AVEN_248685-1 [Araneus ventricosus]
MPSPGMGNTHTSSLAKSPAVGLEPDFSGRMAGWPSWGSGQTRFLRVWQLRIFPSSLFFGERLMVKETETANGWFLFYKAGLLQLWELTPSGVLATLVTPASVKYFDNAR